MKPVEDPCCLPPADEQRPPTSLGVAKAASARVELEWAVRTFEEACAGRPEADAHELESWHVFLGSRWSLVCTFERDGTRYVVAREDGPPATGIEGLTRTERTVIAYTARGLTTKQAAYALGLSPSTVRVLLMRAVRRCGFKNRGELLEVWARRAGDEPPVKP